MQEITIQKQPKRSKICGQCCLAMAANKPLDNVLTLLGKKGTKTSDLVKAAKKLGLKVPVERLRFIDEDTVFPSLYIAQVKWPKRKNWHWVLVSDGALYDPSPTTRAGGRLNAFLELKRK